MQRKVKPRTIVSHRITSYRVVFISCVISFETTTVNLPINVYPISVSKSANQCAAKMFTLCSPVPVKSMII